MGKLFQDFTSSKMFFSQGCIFLFALYISGIHPVPQPLDTVNINLNIDEASHPFYPPHPHESAAGEDESAVGGETLGTDGIIEFKGKPFNCLPCKGKPDGTSVVSPRDGGNKCDCVNGNVGGCTDKFVKPPYPKCEPFIGTVGMIEFEGKPFNCLPCKGKPDTSFPPEKNQKLVVSPRDGVNKCNCVDGKVGACTKIGAKPPFPKCEPFIGPRNSREAAAAAG